MALTGGAMFLFVVAHLVGNLQIFLGPKVLNHYAHVLKMNPEILWPSRIGLLVCVAIHIWTSVLLTIENRRARLERYGEQKLVSANLASRTMIWSTAGAFFPAFFRHIFSIW